MNELEDLVRGLRSSRACVIDAYGHVSALAARSDALLPRPVIAPEKVQEEDLLEYDLDSRARRAQGRESVRERSSTARSTKHRPEVMAVCTTIRPRGALQRHRLPMRPLFHMAAFIGEGLPTSRFRGMCRKAPICW